MNKLTPDFWQDVSVGSIVQIKDEQALKDSADRGMGFNPLSYTVGEIRNLSEVNGFATWKMLRLDDPGQQTLHLLVKIVDDLVDVRVYYAPDADYVPITRDEIIAQGMAWMFDSSQGIDPSEAMYAATFDYTESHGDGTAVDLTYQRKNPTLATRMNISPAPSGLPQPMMALVTEYSTGQQAENPELLITEEGDGGLVRLFFGAPISENDFDVMKG